MAEMMKMTLDAGRIIQDATWVNFNDYIPAVAEVKAAEQQVAQTKE
jgi:pyruvate ferredoxin oxidoreductase alpha subunit/oxalate oxidoreductase subunit alpha